MVCGFGRMLWSAAAVFALVMALPGAALAVEAEADVPAVEPMGFYECLGAIETAAAAHEDRVEFEGGVSREVFNEVAVYLFWPDTPGRACKENYDAMMVRDRYAIKGIQGYALPCHTEYPVVSAEIEYYFSASEVAKAEKVVDKVAKKAKAVKGRSGRIKYIHDWVARNAVYTGLKSPVWKKSSYYGVPASKVNHAGSTAQLLSHRGRCYSYTMTFLRICKAAGIGDITYTACEVKANGTWGTHAIAAVKDKAGAEGKWRYIDVTWDDPLYHTAGGKIAEYNKVAYKYYMKSKTYMVKKGYRL